MSYRRETRADAFLRAARVPHTLESQKFGLWEIQRQKLDGAAAYVAGCSSMTVLTRWTAATLHLPFGDIVMEDSLVELRRHIPIWLAAEGRVLKTGLGLGCVVRGLLSNPKVDHVDVVEIDPHICRVVGAEFRGNSRVTLHQADALTWDFGDLRWDFAWHDIWCEGNDGLQVLHAKLLTHYVDAAKRQGAWMFPREVSRVLPFQLIGGPKPRRRAA